MYQAKAAGAGGFAVFDPEMHAGLVERVRLEADLRTRRGRGRSSSCTTSRMISHAHRPDHRRRGPGPLAAPRARARSRRSSSSRSRRPPGSSATSACGCSARPARRPSRWQASTSTDRTAEGLGQRLAAPAAPRRLARPGPTGPRRTPASPPDRAHPRDDRERAASTTATRPVRRSTDAARPRRAPGDRRLRDRLLVAQLPAPVPRRRAQDRPQLRRAALHRRRRGAGQHDPPARAQPCSSRRSPRASSDPQEMLILRRQGCTTGQGFHFSPPVDAASSGGDAVRSGRSPRRVHFHLSRRMPQAGYQLGATASALNETAPASRQGGPSPHRHGTPVLRCEPWFPRTFCWRDVAVPDAASSLHSLFKISSHSQTSALVEPIFQYLLSALAVITACHRRSILTRKSPKYPRDLPSAPALTRRGLRAPAKALRTHRSTCGHPLPATGTPPACVAAFRIAGLCPDHRDGNQRCPR